MATNRRSWHSVSAVTGPGTRRCVSNYYFSTVSPEGEDYFHATSFRGEPDQTAADIIMRADAALRTGVLRVLGNRYRNKHVYKRQG